MSKDAECLLIANGTTWTFSMIKQMAGRANRSMSMPVGTIVIIDSNTTDLKLAWRKIEAREVQAETKGYHNLACLANFRGTIEG